ncbi:MAG: hypothetical protein AAGK78_14790, partial [Planctomycetota bacterium]
GGNGNDELYDVGYATQSLSGGPGNDLIETSNGIATISGGDGDDIIRVTLANNNGGNRIETGEGNNLVTVASGENTIIGGTGQDTIVGGADDDLIFGFDGDDSLDGGDGDDTLDGGDGFDIGLNGETLISIEDDGSGGGGGDDLGPTGIFYENAGITVNGTSDADTVLVQDFGGNVRVQLNDTVRWFGKGFLPSGLRINTGGGNDSVAASETDLTTVQRGGNGDDTLLGGTGIDTLDGGAGFDTGRFGETLISIEDDGSGGGGGGGGGGDLQGKLDDAVAVARSKYAASANATSADEFFSYTDETGNWVTTDVDAWTAGYAPGTYWTLDRLADRRGLSGSEGANAVKYADNLLRSFPFPEDVGHRDIPGLLPW